MLKEMEQKYTILDILLALQLVETFLMMAEAHLALIEAHVSRQSDNFKDILTFVREHSRGIRNGYWPS